MANKRSPRRPFRAVRFLLAAALAAGFLWWSNTSLEVTQFAPAFSDLPAGFDGCRIVVLSDLHSAQFGRGNQRLYDAVAAQAPEYIFLTGDLLDQYRLCRGGYAASMAEALSAIAPTYYVTGNHEWALAAYRS